MPAATRSQRMPPTCFFHLYSSNKIFIHVISLFSSTQYLYSSFTQFVSLFFSYTISSDTPSHFIRHSISLHPTHSISILKLSPFLSHTFSIPVTCCLSIHLKYCVFLCYCHHCLYIFLPVIHNFVCRRYVSSLAHICKSNASIAISLFSIKRTCNIATIIIIADEFIRSPLYPRSYRRCFEHKYHPNDMNQRTIWCPCDVIHKSYCALSCRSCKHSISLTVCQPYADNVSDQLTLGLFRYEPL